MKRILLFVLVVVTAVVCSCSKDFSFSKGGFYMEMDGMYKADAMNAVPDLDEPSGDRYDEIVENEFISTADEPTSTFSVDCDGASYANMRRYINDGVLPVPNSVRIEEFLNYFTFDYPEPAGQDAISVNSELYPCPWQPDHCLLRLGIKGKSLDQRPKSNFVFLVDVSGSMDSPDKLELLKSGLKTLVDQLDQTDRISLITYSGSVSKVLSSTPVSEKNKIKKAIGKLTASGSTNGGAAMKMAYEEALQNLIPGGNNRIVMGTDGDFNVGVTSTDALKEMVQDYSSKGIYITICGFGRGNLNDGMIETITNAGNGTYEYIDSEAELVKVFIKDYGKFFAVANDVKTQVTFDPTVVRQYRLIGYENRVMSNEDFDNDAKDASEIGAGQTITALYEIELTGQTLDLPAGTFSVRYKKSLGDASILVTKDLPATAAHELSPNMALASACAAYGMVLRDSKFKGDASFSTALSLVRASVPFDPNGYRAQFADLIQQASRIQRQQQ